ncbi:hypothetical protein LL037_16620 [Clostridium estertheticum]|uniref:Uncharacterized protein n=1 Tax=Clostridium estertheticum TaxID=238834 RepID=A0AA47EKA9_9CLOT|nr:hypothetical protein [Clostridium estertheticum]MBU3154631.1 hypothetical protein [Clostridium estertheticum]MBU3198776.1 hypothetical protein [Clostridium estertheticum]WAG61787.1 hypothetical protein LL038_05950 [Clostridium estertheticum]WAG64090.1 hypothetical protein LL037_16620 [Clostridium estertheticum]
MFMFNNIIKSLIPVVIVTFSNQDVVGLLNEFDVNSQYRDLCGENYGKIYNDLWYYLEDYKDIIIDKVGRNYIWMVLKNRFY